MIMKVNHLEYIKREEEKRLSRELTLRFTSGYMNGVVSLVGIVVSRCKEAGIMEEV